MPNRRATVADFLRRNPLPAFVTLHGHEGTIRSTPPSADFRRWLQRELGETKAIDVNLARWFADPRAALSPKAEEEDHNGAKKRGRGSDNKAFMFIDDDAVERMREALRSKQRLRI